MNSNQTFALVFFVNGKKVVENNPDPEWTLLHYLRRKLQLCGTKLGCAEGGCGACTVMVSKYNREKNCIVHNAVNACLAPVCSMHGLAVTTIEGIGSTKTRLHPVQERIAKSHGSQCGFCTPGIVMSMYTLLRNMPKPSYEDLETAFQGNLCRCTGYRPIIEGYKTFLEDWEQGRGASANREQGGCSNGVCGLGKDCCKNGLNNEDEPRDTFNNSKYSPYDPSQEPIFPPELKLSSEYDKQTLVFKGPTVVWHRPISLIDLLKIRNEHQDSKIVTGNTEVGVEVKFKNCLYPVIVMPNHIPELNTICRLETGIRVGASVTLSELEAEIENLKKIQPTHKTKIFQAITEMLHWFAGKQIRNVASVGGNIMTGSPISDLNPIFMAAGVTLKFKSIDGEEDMTMDHTFFTGYRKNKTHPNQVLISIHIPYTSQNQYFKAYKQAKRRDDDIAIVNMALSVTLESDKTIRNMNLAFGGMAPITVMATKTSQQLQGQTWDENMLQKAFNCLTEELPLSPSAPGGMIQYRQSLTLSLFFKAFLEISSDLHIKIADEDKSAIGGFKSKVLKSSQYYNVSENVADPIGKPTVHASAIKQATGEAVYCDDMPLLEGELFLALVISNKAHAKIVSIDPSTALEMPGVKAFLSAKDISPDRNSIGPIFHDEEVFVAKTITGQGQAIGAIVAVDQMTAQRAAKAVHVVYEDLEPVIITIEDAIKAESYYTGSPALIVKGSPGEAFKNADHVIENQLHMGGQEHFYLESHVARAVPKEDDELEIFASSQHPSEITKLASHVLGIPNNRIVGKVKRIGGGFGGKESRGLLISMPVAIAANKLKVPVRCMLDRDEDMVMTGGRHPFLFKYKIAFKADGKILAIDLKMYCNAGYSSDLSVAVLERAMLHCENAYNIPHMRIEGYVCKTHIHSNTAFRGFGGPQGMFFAETIIRNIAEKLGMPSHEVALKNFYTEGDVTHYHQTLTNFSLLKCWDECIAKSDFHNRMLQVEQYNRQNRWKKRGISLVPTKFGIAFSIKFLNQAGALVHVYLDGSVLLTHGGTEMGQGLHTKMIQVASKALGIDQSKIYISETSTDKVPNTSATAASVSSDINGMAVLNACNQILERLEPIRKKHPNAKWESLIQHAYLECISLSAAGFYATPNIGYDLHTNKGVPYNYFTYGVACSEVEIDCLTGDHQVIRTDIVMDVGQSLNPAIDVGQIEGAFMQGYGLFTLEELIYSPEGYLYSRGPGAYKIPGFADIPGEFNVSLLKGASNPRAIYSSKAIGEPPLFLSSSVFFAIREAIKAARKNTGSSILLNLNSPATAARIRMACEDHITNKFKEPAKGTFKPWNVVP